LKLGFLVEFEGYLLLSLHVMGNLEASNRLGLGIENASQQIGHLKAQFLRTPVCQ
jgi:hypothetical protein